MANPLDRTWYNTLIDDDGSGTTGTVWNKTQVDGLMDTIDARLVGIADIAAPPGSGLLNAAGFIDADTVTPQAAIKLDNVTGGVVITAPGGYAYLEQVDPSQPANARRYRLVNTAQALQIVTIDDAGGGAIRVNVPRTGAVSLYGGLALPTVGHIAFPAVATLSALGNVLDDFRESTFVTTLRGTTGQTGQVYTDRTGFYVKIGRLVHCTGHMFLSTLGTVSGDVVFGDLPFPSAAGGINASGLVGHFGGLSTPVAGLSFLVPPGVNYGFVRYVPPGGATASNNLPATALASVVEFDFAVTYFTDN